MHSSDSIAGALGARGGLENRVLGVSCAEWTTRRMSRESYRWRTSPMITGVWRFVFPGRRRVLLKDANGVATIGLLQSRSKQLPFRWYECRQNSDERGSLRAQVASAASRGAVRTGQGRSLSHGGKIRNRSRPSFRQPSALLFERPRRAASITGAPHAEQSRSRPALFRSNCYRAGRHPVSPRKPEDASSAYARSVVPVQQPNLRACTVKRSRERFGV